MRFRDKVVVVTGAAQGIGLETARLFASEGALIAVNDLNEEGANAAADAIGRDGGSAFAIAGNVADREAVAAQAREVIGRWGRIDVLVNNAGFGLFSNAETATPQSWRNVNSVVAEGAFYWAQAAGTLSMIPNRSGAIVNLGSLAGLGGTLLARAPGATDFAPVARADRAGLAAIVETRGGPLLLGGSGVAR